MILEEERERNAVSEATGTKNSRQYGTTITSGEGKIMANGIMADASGKDIGNMADVTKGAANVRNTMTGKGYGMSGTDFGIDENSGNMTYGGRDMGIKAIDYNQGINDTNRRTLSDAYSKATGDEVVSARQYAEVGSGLGANAMRWQDGKVLLGGHEVPYQFIDNEGNAHVSKSVLDNIINQIREENGTKRSTDLVNDVYGKYADGINTQMDKVINRNEWTYNPENDPVYDTYADIYARNAEEAYNRAMGTYGGLYSRPTSYQRQAALTGYNDQMQRMADVIPTLAQQDYNRYYSEQGLNREALSELQGERSNELNALYGANTDEINRMRDTDETNYNRYYDALFTYPMAQDKLAMSHVDAQMYPMHQAMAMQEMQNQLDSQGLANDYQQMENILNKAYQRGYYTPDEAAWLGVDVNTSPYYPEVAKMLYRYKMLSPYGLK